jgi:hypothetical protein
MSVEKGRLKTWLVASGIPLRAMRQRGASAAQHTPVIITWTDA